MKGNKFYIYYNNPYPQHYINYINADGKVVLELS